MPTERRDTLPVVHKERKPMEGQSSWESRHLLHLLDVVKDVHKQQGDDVCWMDIDRIFIAAGLPVPDRKVGNKVYMLKNCERFIDRMCANGDWPTYAEMKAVLQQLTNAYEGDGDMYSIAEKAQRLLERMQ